MEADTSKPTVVLTGFGPFGSHKVNASWVAVDTFAKNGGLGDKFNLVVREIPVIYEEVLDSVPKLWDLYNPKLMVHVGVSKVATTMVLEQKAHNDGYKTPDILGKLPKGNRCRNGDCVNTLESRIDVRRVCNSVICDDPNIIALMSQDAGRFLCEFIYYTSLSINQNSVFIHIPPLNAPYSAEESAAFLKRVILQILKELDNSVYI